jgi:hypothetical protein
LAPVRQRVLCDGRSSGRQHEALAATEHRPSHAGPLHRFADCCRIGRIVLAVVRRGKVIARTPAATATLDLPGRPASVDWRRTT